MEFRFRRAIFLKFSLCLWAVCVGYTGGFFLWEVFGQSRKFEEKKTLELKHQLRLSQDLLAKENSRELVELLRHGLRTGDLDFFGWRQEGQWDSMEGRKPQDLMPQSLGQVDRIENALVAVVPFEKKELVIGAYVDWRARAREVISTRITYLAKDILFFALALLTMGVFFFQELARSFLPKAVVERDWSSPRPKFVPKILRDISILPPKSGTFASFQLEKSFAVDSEAKASELDDLIFLCSRLAERYGGNRVENGCMGASFIFSDSDLALSAARDWRSISPASIFVSQGTSFPAAAGRPIYGADLSRGLKRLSALELDSGIWLNKKIESRHFRVDPKMGMFAAEAHTLLPEAIAHAREGNPSGLGIFRLDEDLVKIVEDLRNGSWNREHFLGALGALRSFQALSEGKILADSYRLLLAKELNEKDSYRLSAVMALAAHLFHPKAISKELERTFLDVLALPDRRTKANAIEIFIHFFPDREIPALKPYLRDIDNRISANALVKAALERFDDKVVRKIEERLQGGSVAHVASALYAVGEIADYYQRTDPLYLGTKIGFLKIFESIPTWAVHPNPMVGRQALVAAKKLGDPGLNKKLEKVFSSNKDESVVQLFATVYGWRKGEKAA